jgi:hypothetical protein
MRSTSLFLSRRSKVLPGKNPDDLGSRDQSTGSKSRRASNLDENVDSLQLQREEPINPDENVDDLQMQKEKPKPVEQLLMKLWKN